MFAPVRKSVATTLRRHTLPGTLSVGLFLLLLGNARLVVSEGQDALFGVNPTYARVDGAEFVCDGKPLAAAKVNDDYCDCVDGTDEPGTSACGNSHFWCENIGYKGQYVFSSRVNDGICDCCDGSDEKYAAPSSNCQNSCLADGEEYRREVEAEKARRALGLTKKQEYIARAKTIVEEQQENANALREKLKVAEVRLEDARKKKEMEELLENQEKVALNTDGFQTLIASLRLNEVSTGTLQKLLIDFARELGQEQKLLDMLKVAVGNDDIPVGGLLPKKPELEVSVDPDGETSVANGAVDDLSDLDVASMSNEELLAAADRILADTEKTIEDHGSKQEISAESTSAAASGESEQAPASEESEQVAEDNVTPEEAAKALFARVDGTDYVRDAAKEAREALSAAEKERDDTQASLTGIEGDDLTRYGDDNVFLPLKDECFEKKVQGYNYNFCFYGSAKQDFNSLGTMTGLEPPNADGTRLVKFTGGASCWNGPSRSLHVTLICAGDHEILDVYEPSMCEYHMKFATPVVC
eukprot:Stramenopile-MAST_4_protein_867